MVNQMSIRSEFLKQVFMDDLDTFGLSYCSNWQSHDTFKPLGVQMRS